MNHWLSATLGNISVIRTLSLGFTEPKDLIA